MVTERTVDIRVTGIVVRVALIFDAGIGRCHVFHLGIILSATCDADGDTLVGGFRIDELQIETTRLRIDGGRGIDLCVGLTAFEHIGREQGTVATLGEQLLIVVVGGAPQAAIVKPDQVGTPFVEAFLAEQRCVGGHHHHVGVALQTQPVGRRPRPGWSGRHCWCRCWQTHLQTRG